MKHLCLQTLELVLLMFSPCKLTNITLLVIAVTMVHLGQCSSCSVDVNIWFTQSLTGGCYDPLLVNIWLDTAKLVSTGKMAFLSTFYPLFAFTVLFFPLFLSIASLLSSLSSLLIPLPPPLSPFYLLPSVLIPFFPWKGRVDMATLPVLQ